MAVRRTKSAPKGETKAKKSVAKEENPRKRNPMLDKELAAKVVALRDGGKDGKKTPWADITKELGIDQPKALTLYLHATVRPKDKIQSRDEDKLKADIVRLRDEEGLAWHVIGARAGITTSKVKNLYRDATGKAATASPRKTKEKPAPKSKSQAKRVAEQSKARKPAAKKSTNGAKAIERKRAAKKRTRRADPNPS